MNNTNSVVAGSKKTFAGGTAEIVIHKSGVKLVKVSGKYGADFPALLAEVRSAFSIPKGTKRVVDKRTGKMTWPVHSHTTHITYNSVWDYMGQGAAFILG